METRLYQPVPITPLAPSRLDTAAVRAGVSTNLPPPQAVAAQVGAEQVRWHREKREREASRTSETHVDLDRETGELIYRVIDLDTRETLDQSPHEAILKLRAYIKARDEAARKL